MCGDASLGDGVIVDFGAGLGLAADGAPVIEPCVLLGVDGSLFDWAVAAIGTVANATAANGASKISTLFMKDLQ